MEKQFFPGDLRLFQSRHAAEHATQCGFNTSGNLVMCRAIGDAVDESALLVAIGKLQIVEETAVGRELPRSRSRGIGVLPFPGVGPGDGNGTRVGHCGRTSSAKELDSRVEFAVGPELGGRKGEVTSL